MDARGNSRLRDSENKLVIELPTTTVSELTITDLDAVDELMKRCGSTLGFLPHAALEDYLKKKGVLGAKAQDGGLVGYVMFASNRDRFRIAQLCVSEAYRGQGIARQLLDAMEAIVSTQKVIMLRCRNDFAAHGMWPKLGFVPISESPGRSREGHLLTLWRLQLAPDDQLELFRANLSDDVLDVVIDAQIFFDFDSPDSDVAQPSKAMISDVFVDLVNLWFTDELLSEINRSRSATERHEARTRCGQFLEVKHHPRLVDGFVTKLKQILPDRTASQLSDIMHLAKTAASDIDVFVTRDGPLLSKAAQLHEAVNLQVISPTALIVKLRELSETQPYVADYVSGPGLAWRRLSSAELLAFPFYRFLHHGEIPRELEMKVGSFLSDASGSEVEVLWSGDEPIVLRGLAYGSPGALTVSLCRVATSVRSSSMRRFPIADAINRTVVNGLEVVKVEDATVSIDMLPDLLEMGFTRCDGGFIRFCLAHYLDQGTALSRVAGLAPNCAGNYENMSRLELERCCSPLISDVEQNFFLISIRPSYARNLVDRRLSSSDMFGGDPEVLLRWGNVYYRAATYHKMLTAPGRILWYVSGDSKEIAAVSHLDEVVIDKPKELFKRFRRYGTFEWRHLYQTCGGDTSKMVMALLFSHTFPLRRRVPLGEIWKVFDGDGVSRMLQSPRRLQSGTFRRLFKLGYPEYS